MILLDGKEAARSIREEMRLEIVEYKEKYNTQPRLVIIQIGHDKGSQTYANSKIRMCDEVGIKVIYLNASKETTEEELIKMIEQYNNDITVEGIIIETPLPEHINYQKIIKALDPKKDVDGFHSDNMGRTCLELDGIKPATALGTKLLLEHYGVDWTGMDIVVVGRGDHVGLPIAILLGNNERGTVTSCHVNTKNLKSKTLQADMVVVAVGKPNLITADMVKDGVIIVDVGINVLDDKSIVGDVDFNGVKDKCSYISPVPRGVGPMTVVTLLKNTLWAYKYRYRNGKLDE